VLADEREERGFEAWTLLGMVDINADAGQLAIFFDYGIFESIEELGQYSAVLGGWVSIASFGNYWAIFLDRNPRR
jgi:hypothetical protein